MNEQNKPKVAFFDWFATLSSSVFWEQLKDPNHPHHNLADKLEFSMFTNLGHLINPWMRGEYTTEEVLTEVSIDSGIPYDIVMEEFIASCKTMTLVSEEIPILISQLRELGVRTIIATDNMDSFTRWTIPAMGLDTMFDDILNSYDLGALKGDIDNNSRLLFFHDYLVDNGIGPQDTVIFDDSDHKLVVLSKGGMSCIKVEPHTGLVTELNKLIEDIKL